MPAIRIPITQGQWKGQFQGDYYGDLARTFNVDLDRNPGKAELSERHNVIFHSDTADTGGDSNFRRIEAISEFNDGLANKYFATAFDTLGATRDRLTIYRTADTNLDTGWAADSNADYGANDSDRFHAQDIITYEDNNFIYQFVTANDTKVSRRTSEIFSQDTSLSIVDSGVFHPMDVFENSLLVASRHKVHQRNTDCSVVSNRVLIPKEFYIHHIFHTPTRVYFLGSDSNLRGVVSEWDGFSNLPLGNYRMSHVPLTGVDYYGSPLIVTAKGQFLERGGNGFIPIKDPTGEVLSLPVNKQRGNSLIGSTAFPLDPSKFAIARRGMVVDGEYIKFNLAKSRTEKFGEFKQNSGIWVLNPVKRTLYNSSSLGNNDNLGHGFAVQSGAMMVNPEGGIRLASGKFYASYDTNTVSSICTFREMDDTSIQRGFIESQWVNLPVPEGSWETLWVKHRKFTDTNSRIIAKARIQEGPYFVDTDFDLPNLAQVDFDDDTAFTVLLSGLQDSLIVGDEIEVLNGPNAGKLAHITAISGTHGDTQVITIDESFDSSASLSTATFKRWSKLRLANDSDSGITAGDSEIIHRFTIPAEMGLSHKIAVKLELRGRARDISIEDLALQYEVSQANKI